MNAFKRKQILLPVLLLLAALGGCNQKIISGYYTPDAFVQATPWRTKVATHYKPNPAALEGLAKADSFEMRVFMGTWCHDSRRDVPKLLAFRHKLPLRKLDLVVLDTTRIDAQRLAPANGVRGLYVMQVLRGGKELGRITERPKQRLEQDLLSIVCK
jgi:hypothetical protein